MATYKPTSTSSATQLLGSDFTISQVSEMYIDDVKQSTVSATYTFSDTNEHTVKIVMGDRFTSAYCMFAGCTSLTSLDVSSFNTSKVTNMSYMFSNCSSLTSLDVSSFDTSNVTNMSGMFQSCSKLASLDVTNFDTSNVTSMSGMFRGCSSLTRLSMAGGLNSSVTVTNMFSSIATTGTFYYSSGDDYSAIIAKLPSSWTAVAQ